MRSYKHSRTTKRWNPRYKATFDSDADSTGVKRALKAAGFKGARVRGGEKRKPGPYALFVKKHMAGMKAKGLSMGEAMKAIGELWRTQKGTVRKNPAFAPFGWAQVRDGVVIKTSTATRKPKGAGWGAINTSGTSVGDRAFLSQGDVYLHQQHVGGRKNPDLGITYQVIPAPIPNPSRKHRNPSSNSVQRRYAKLIAEGRYEEAGTLYKRSHAAMKGSAKRQGRKNPHHGVVAVRDLPSSQSLGGIHAEIRDPYQATVIGVLDAVNPTAGTVTIEGKVFRLIDPNYSASGASYRAYKAAVSKQKLVGRKVQAEVQYHFSQGWVIYGGSKIKLAGRTNPRGFKVWTVTFHLTAMSQAEHVRRQVERWGGKLKRGKGYVATFANRDDAYQAQKGVAAWGVSATVEESVR